MSMIKIKCKTEFNGVLYAGIALAAGVNATISEACDPRLGLVMTFDKTNEGGETFPVPSPVLMVQAITSVSVGDEAPPEYLVLTPGE